jgi:hypothetical protein
VSIQSEVRKLCAEATRRGCRVTWTADGHLKLYAADGVLLGKMKSAGRSGDPYHVQRLWKRLPEPVVEVGVETVLGATWQPTDGVDSSGAVRPVVGVLTPPSPRSDELPGSWLEWMTADDRTGTRSARRRRWRLETGR